MNRSTTEIHAVMMGFLSAPSGATNVEPPADSPDWENWTVTDDDMARDNSGHPASA